MSALDMATRSALRTVPPRPLTTHIPGARRTLVQTSVARSEGSAQGSDVLAEAAAQGKSPVTWNEYLKLRKQRRFAGLVTTWPITILSGLGTGAYLATNELPFSFAGIGPMILSAIGVLAGTGAGLLAGPMLGTTAWTWINRSKANSIAQKDKAFFNHIRKNRVDPSMQSVQNPIPDFYVRVFSLGEKIGSLHEYRQWLRDQSTYRRKVSYGVKQDEGEM